ncbi:helix-turn-helix domain-containing protein [Streptococcus sp. 20-1249]|uniref:helix-turn-helix domain-containing protein n=1 Tax=Streptococcus hepaticus TaxID=3349163 RepID=UPI003749D04F
MVVKVGFIFLNVIEILAERGLTVVDLAKMADIPKTSIYNAKYHDIGFEKMVKLADALEVSLDEFRKE